MKDGKFEIGDKIKSIRTCGRVNKGDTGTVLGFRDSPTRIGISWDRNVGGHDCGHGGCGSCKTGHGWYVNTNDIQLPSESQKQKASKIGQFMLWKAIELKCPEYCTTEDLEDINGWSEETLDRIIAKLQSLFLCFNDADTCPFCIANGYETSEGKDCFKCGFAKRHAKCSSSESLYTRVQKLGQKVNGSIGNEKIKVKIEELFPQVTLEIAGHKMDVSDVNYDGDCIITKDGKRYNTIRLKIKDKYAWLILEPEIDRVTGNIAVLFGVCPIWAEKPR